MRPNAAVARSTLPVLLLSIGAAMVLTACGDDAGASTVAEGRATIHLGDETATVDLSAAEDDGVVTGTAAVTRDGGPPFDIAVECSTDASDSVVIVAGEVSESADEDRPVGSRVAVLIKEGEPDGMSLWFEDPPRASSCSAFLDGIPDDVLADPNIYQPVDGDIRTG